MSEELDGWEKKEHLRYLRRCKALQEHGLNASESEVLAKSMLYRDREIEFDNRRICLECKHLNANNYCLNWKVCKAPMRFEPCRTVLWRCDGFKIKGT